MGSTNSTPRKRLPPRGDLCINIKACKDPSDASIETTGYIQEAINENDRKIFKITDGRLKQAIMNYHKKFPNDVFVSSPTPWGDLYTMYKWDDITRKLEAVQSEVISINKEQIVAANRKVVNNSDVKGRFCAEINYQNLNTVTTRWAKKEKLSVGMKIDYKIVFPESPDFSFQSSWGEDTHKSLTTEASFKVDVELEPGQEVDASLYLTRCVMEVMVSYESILLGMVACHFDEGLKYSYRGFHIANVQKAGELPTVVESSEVLTIVFYTDGEIKLSNN